MSAPQDLDAINPRYHYVPPEKRAVDEMLDHFRRAPITETDDMDSFIHKNTGAGAILTSRLEDIAELIQALTYGEMMELSAALWSKRENKDSEVTEKELPGIFHRWSAK